MEDAEEVLERDAAFLLDECVLLLWNVGSLVSRRSIFCTSQLQGHLWHEQVVVTTDVCISHYPHILSRATPLAIVDDMINLTMGSSVR